jgi:D-alanyl-D-alanine carboxypeptidase
VAATLAVGTGLATAGSSVAATRTGPVSTPLPPVNPVALQQAINAVPAPGITSAVVSVTGSRGRWSGASGLADVTTGQAASPRDRFRIGSVTKVFTATVVLQLAAEHRLDLDQTVQHYLPGVLPVSYPPITVTQLLNHSSGLPAPTGIGDGEGSAEQFVLHRFDPLTPTQILAGLAGQPMLFAPGTAQTYNGINYYLLGMLIEARTGHPYAQEVATRILRPLQLTQTAVSASTDYLIAGPHLHGYLTLDASGSTHLVDVTEQSPYPWAEGGMISSTADLGRFITALIGGRLLPPRQTQDLFTVPDVPYLGASQCRAGTPAGRACFGMGLESAVIQGTTLWGKTGSRPGYTEGAFATRDLQRALVYAFTPTDLQATNMQFILRIADAALTPPNRPA